MVVTTQQQAIPAGYKQTEVGVMPQEWQIHGLRDCLVQSATYGVVKAGTFRQIGVPMLRGGDIADGNLADELPLISVEKSNEYSRTVLRELDVVIALVGYPGETAVVPARLAGANISRAVGLLRPNNNLSPTFLACYLNSPSGRKEFLRPGAGSAQLVVNLRDLNELRVPVPPFPEQCAIAAALADADALIAALDQLIAKKRDIKQATMQQLLTGKRRLPGFRGEWEMKQLGSLGTFRGGSGFPTRDQGVIEGDYPFFKVSDMNNEGNSTFMINSNNWISVNARKQLGAKIFPANTIVVAKIGAAIFLERKKILSQDSCLDNNMMGFVLDEGAVSARFVHYLFLNIQLGKLVAATALPSLNSRDIAALTFGIPELPEQQAIAAVLSDIDADIVALEARRDKSRALKQGMMQRLLTGTIRLV